MRQLQASPSCQQFSTLINKLDLFTNLRILSLSQPDLLQYARCWDRSTMIPSRGLATAALFAARRPLISSRSLGCGFTAAYLRQRLGQNAINRPVSRVWESTVVNPDDAVPPIAPEEGADKSGHITTHSNEAILFFDSESSCRRTIACLSADMETRYLSSQTQ